MKKQKLPLLFLALPGIILIFLFGYLPLFGLVIAFKNVDYSKGIWASDWVGLKNFEFFFKSNDALRVTRNTLVMNALFIVFTLIVSVSVAIMLYYVGRRMLRVTQTVLFPGLWPAMRWKLLSMPGTESSISFSIFWDLKISIFITCRNGGI